MPHDPVCCGCSLVNDYGTSLAFGDGSHETPFFLELTDPEFVRPVVRAERTTATDLVGGVDTLVSFETEIFDTALMWDPALPSQFVFTTDGIYVVGSMLEITTGGTSSARATKFRKNGTDIVWQHNHSNFNSTDWLTMTYPIRANQGDFVELIVNASSSSSDYVDGNFWMCYLGKVVS